MAIYLDNAATTKPAADCIAEMQKALSSCWGNPSSLHGMGLAAEQCIHAARGQIAAAMGLRAAADLSDVLTFTSGATESNHTAIRGIAGAYGRHKKRVITTTVEHASVKAAFDMLENQGFEVIRLKPDQLDRETVLSYVNGQTCLISMMLVNNETGAILPVQEIFDAVKSRDANIITHCDAVQGFLKLPVTVSRLADLVTVSGHKVHAAKGIGALYHKKGIRLAPLLTGGAQERGFRAGTESVPLIAGFGAAAAALAKTVDTRFSAVSALHGYAAERLSAMDGVTVQSPENCSPYILSISVKGLRSETMLNFLSAQEIYVSSGSACHKGEQSGVLAEFGISRDAADSTLRLSFCAENTAAEIDSFCAALRGAQERLVRKR